MAETISQATVHDKRVCSTCGGNTLVYKGAAQWRHDEQNNLLCKKCYDSNYRNAHKLIDLSKLKKKNGLTFVKPPVKKIAVNKSKNSSKLTSTQKEELKEKLSIPLIGKMSDAGSYQTCSMCSNSYQYLYNSAHQYTILSFEVLVRAPKRHTITCYLCNDCISNMNSFILSIKKLKHVSNKIDTAITGRDKKEGTWLWRNRIGWQLKGDGGYSYHKLPATDWLQRADIGD